MAKYLLGVASSRSLRASDISESYWCVGEDTQVGDHLLLYSPRSASPARQGVFAECLVLTPPNKKSQDNCLCSAYGVRNSTLFHVKIKIVKRFDPSITAKDMKSDPLLRDAGFVRKNFQGTCFRIQEDAYKRILKLAKIKADQVENNKLAE